MRLFLEQGYKNTSVTQIVAEANIARGSYQNQFPTKDAVLMELVKTMFSDQFSAARTIAPAGMPPVYTYAVETAIQLTLTESNENLREIYLEAYTLPNTVELIHMHTAEELYQIFGSYMPDCERSDFYELEGGTAGLMRGYMARKCDIHFPLDRKLRRFLETSLRAYTVPESEVKAVLAFIASLDMRTIVENVMQHLFALLEMKYHFKFSAEI